jgi:ML domain-containing protein
MAVIKFVVSKLLSLTFLVLLGFTLLHQHKVESSRQFVVTRFEDEPLIDDVTGTPYKNCGGSRSELKQVELIPCDIKESDHCVIDRGENVTFKMSFLSQESSKTLQLKIYGIIDYFPVPFPCPQVSNQSNQFVINYMLLCKISYHEFIFCCCSQMHVKIREYSVQSLKDKCTITPYQPQCYQNIQRQVCG